MSETSTLIGYGSRTIGREERALVPTPVATKTHRPVQHHEIVQALIAHHRAANEESRQDDSPFAVLPYCGQSSQSRKQRDTSAVWRVCYEALRVDANQNISAPSLDVFNPSD
jgi:hypothetical protein